MSDQADVVNTKGFPPAVILGIGIVAVSTASLFIRFAQESSSSLVIAAGRMAVATLVLAPIALTGYRHELKAMSRRQLMLLALGGIFLGFHFATWITSLEYTSVASSVVLVTTAPLWVAILAPLLLHEKLSKALLLGMAVALIGSTIVILSSDCLIESGRIVCGGFADAFKGRAFIGNTLALAGALLSAGYLIVGRASRGELSLPAYAFIVYGVAAVVLVIMVGVTSSPVLGLTPMTYGWIVLLGLLPQLVGHSSFNWALKYLPATYVSIALLGEPVGTVILAYAFLSEAPTLLEVAGGIMILAGIFIASQTSRLRSTGI